MIEFTMITSESTFTADLQKLNSRLLHNSSLRERSGACGISIDGGVRESLQIAELGFPVPARWLITGRGFQERSIGYFLV